MLIIDDYWPLIAWFDDELVASGVLRNIEREMNYYECPSDHSHQAFSEVFLFFLNLQRVLMLESSTYRMSIFE